MNPEEALKTKFNEVLDLKPEEIVLDQPIGEAHDVDSTELVEISVGLKKDYGFQLSDNDLKKTHTFNDIVEILKTKGAT